MLVSLVGGANYANFIYSTDGTTWQNGTTLTSATTVWGLAYSTTKNIWVAGESIAGGGYMWYSSDGKTWTKTTYAIPGCVAAPIGVNDTGANGPVFLVGGYGCYYTSDNGQAWTQRTSPFGVSTRVWNAYFSPTLKLWAISSDTNQPYMATSSDGINWTTKTTNLTTSVATSLQYIPSISLWICVSTGGGGIITSPDLTTWTARTAEVGDFFSIATGLSDNVSYS